MLSMILPSLAIFLGLLALAIYLRNNWVYKQRMKLIDTKYHEYDNYLSYNDMMYRFWIWDVERLRKEDW